MMKMKSLGVIFSKNAFSTVSKKNQPLKHVPKIIQEFLKQRPESIKLTTDDHVPVHLKMLKGFVEHSKSTLTVAKSKNLHGIIKTLSDALLTNDLSDFDKNNMYYEVQELLEEIKSSFGDKREVGVDYVFDDKPAENEAGIFNTSLGLCVAMKDQGYSKNNTSLKVTRGLLVLRSALNTTVGYKASMEVVNLPREFLYNPFRVYVDVNDGWLTVIFGVGDVKLDQLKEFKISVWL